MANWLWCLFIVLVIGLAAVAIAWPGDDYD
jgi:hypothetical protein